MFREEKKNSRRTALIVCLNILFFIAYIVLGVVQYESNDDEAMNYIAAGSYGPGSQHLFFINIILGFILKLFYAVSHSVNWYLTLMLIINLAAMILLSMVCSESLSTLLSILVTVVLNVTLGEQFYNALQFTKNAALLMITGFISIVIGCRYKNRLFRIMGVGVFALGYMVRFNCILMLLPFFLLFLGVDGMANRKKHDKEYYRSLIISLSVCLGFVLISHGASYLFERRYADWKEYWEYHELRSELIDNGAPHYEDFSAEYDVIGWDATDVRILYDWISIDNDKFSKENLQYIVDFKKSSDEFKLTLDKDYFYRYYVGFYKNTVRWFSYPYIYVVILLLVMIFTGPWGLFFAITSFMGLLLEYGYMVYLDRLRWRVECGIWMVFVMLNWIYLIHNHDKNRISEAADKLKKSSFAEKLRETGKISKYKRLVLVILILLLALEKLVLLGVDFFVKKDCNLVFQSDNTYLRFVNDTYNDGNVYYVDTMTADTKAVNAFKTGSEGADYGRKYVGLGGWFIPSPSWKEYFGEDTPELRDLYNDGVYYVDKDNTNDRMLKYLKKEYNENTEKELIEKHEDIYVWRFYISE